MEAEEKWWVVLAEGVAVGVGPEHVRMRGIADSEVRGEKLAGYCKTGEKLEVVVAKVSAVADTRGWWEDFARDAQRVVDQCGQSDREANMREDRNKRKDATISVSLSQA